MKKSSKLLAGAGLILSLGLLTGCEARRMIETVYGPPPAAKTAAPEETAAPDNGFAPWATEEVEDVYGPPPAEEEPQDAWADEAVQLVYGPPPALEAEPAGTPEAQTPPERP